MTQNPNDPPPPNLPHPPGGCASSCYGNYGPRKVTQADRNQRRNKRKRAHRRREEMFAK